LCRPSLTRHVDKKTRAAHGIFFSGKDIAARVANKIKVQIANGASIADPTCGAGDLLIACMRHAPVGKVFKTATAKPAERMNFSV
jgi:hypothetical protein